MSTTMLRSIAERATVGEPLRVKVTMTESKSISASIDSSVAVKAALASARSHLICLIETEGDFRRSARARHWRFPGISKT